MRGGGDIPYTCFGPLPRSQKVCQASIIGQLNVHHLPLSLHRYPALNPSILNPLAKFRPLLQDIVCVPSNSQMQPCEDLGIGSRATPPLWPRFLSGFFAFSVCLHRYAAIRFQHGTTLSMRLKVNALDCVVRSAPFTLPA